MATRDSGGLHASITLLKNELTEEFDLLTNNLHNAFLDEQKHRKKEDGSEHFPYNVSVSLLSH